VRVTFTRTGERRYGVTVERPDAPTMRMHPAPGHDPAMPLKVDESLTLEW
jgi:hypothetical protein